MNKQEILSEIRRIAKANGGKAPGVKRFSTLTGLREGDWRPELWLRWSDAITEAGCQPNEFCSAHDSELLIRKYIELIRELGHFPIEGELTIKRKKDGNFPSRGTFKQLGSKPERAEKVLQYCEGRPEYNDIILHCTKVAKTKQDNNVDTSTNQVKIGYVYLIKHGSRKEYKIGKTINPIRREGEVRLELPEKIQPVHYIETDDPSGIEKYWHKRFENKRKEGEWFSLTAEDVRAFKRWRKIN